MTNPNKVFKKLRLNQPLNIIIFLLIVLIGFFLLKLYKPINSSSTHTITQDDNGFSPSEIVIRPGDTIIFSTKRGRQFWPASDLHPTHTIYPEFDPTLPIEADKTWSFKFLKEGQWSFHDHLFPSFRGKIVVSKDLELTSKKNEINCDKDTNPSDGLKLECWDKEVDKLLKTSGLDTTFGIVASRFKTDRLFAQNCHVYTHKIGAVAYRKFKNKEDFNLSVDKTSFCGFGFFHGFTEELKALGGDLSEAQKFCDYVSSKVSSKSKHSTNVACFHGIGHGNVDFDNKKNWGNEKAILTPALKLCEQVTRSNIELFGCSSGVFNALSIAYLFNEYKMTTNKTDPFWICREQSDKFKAGCYNDMNVVVWDLGHKDIRNAASYIKDSDEDQYVEHAISGISSLVVRDKLQNTNDFDWVIKDCQKLPSRLVSSCLTGVEGGFFEFGEPQKEYVKALAFCQSNLLQPNQKQVCYERLISSAANRYSAEKLKQVCQMVDPSYSHDCPS